jgi:glycosyltransferase involved in cell wall biosynthesis
MRVLLLNQFYAPDPAPTGQYLQDLAQTLASRGHKVKVLCSRRSYNGADAFSPRETLKDVEIVRLRATGFGRRSYLGKVLDYASFFCSLLMTLLTETKRPDLIVSLTTPPFIGTLGKLASLWHRCRHANWVMDLYPDALYANGFARKNGLLRRLLKTLGSFQVRGAEPVLALGPVMAGKVSVYTGNGTARSPVTWLPLWSDPELAPWPADQPNHLRAERGWPAKDMVFLYSGNMGLGHRLGEFLEAAKRLGPAGPRWVFCGGGKRRVEIETFAQANPGARIEVLDYVPHSQLRTHLCSGDVHLASLNAAWEGSIVPSKLQASFAVGQPVLFVGGHGCETAMWIKESGGGWVVNEGDIHGLLDAVAQALNPDERRKRGAAALDFAGKNFQMSANCTQIARLFEGAAKVN